MLQCLVEFFRVVTLFTPLKCIESFEPLLIVVCERTHRLCERTDQKEHRDKKKRATDTPRDRADEEDDEQDSEAYFLFFAHGASSVTGSASSGMISKSSPMSQTIASGWLFM